MVPPTGGKARLITACAWAMPPGKRTPSASSAEAKLARNRARRARWFGMLAESTR